MKSSEKLPTKLPTDSTLTRDIKLNKYYLNLTISKKVKTETRPFEKAIFIDPGVKNLYTWYSFDSNEGFKLITVGKRDINRISRLLYYKHKLHGKVSKAKNVRKKKSYKKALHRMSLKIRNLISDMHKKVAKWLTNEYDQIHLPKLNFHKCKKLNRKSKEKLVTYRHCELFTRIQDKANENQVCSLNERNESFTSKTCCNCGHLDPNLGNKDIYNCKKCNIVINRDYNGAINIMLRYITSFMTN